MNNAILKITTCLCLLLFIGFGCVTEDYYYVPSKGNIQGNVSVQLKFHTSAGKDIITRAGEKSPIDSLMERIDDVHVLVFKTTATDVNDLQDTDSVVTRSYIQYGVEQKIYLQTDSTYYIFAAANLDAFNSPNGDASTYFDDVHTYGDLKEKFIVIGSSLVPKKLVMTTKGVVQVKLPNEVDQSATVNVFLDRVYSQLELNIYNKVDNEGENLSGVFPVSFTGIHVPKCSYLLERNVANYTEPLESMKWDYSGKYYPDNSATAFTQTQTYQLPTPEAKLVSRNGVWYTKQTVYGFIFENRQGDISGIDSVQQRFRKAPPFAMYAQITSATAVSPKNPKGEVLLSYIHPGKGWSGKTDDPVYINNYDIDRNCIYHMDVYINSIDSVDYDSRRFFLDQLVVLTLPDLSRVDAHYMDIPIFLRGSNGRVKLQSGLGELDANGNLIPETWQPMEHSDPENTKWLRFSWYNPFDSTKARPVHYAGLGTTDAVSSATPIIHFNEFTDYVNTEANPLPPKRTALIRVGYVTGAGTNIEYETGVAGNNENVFYVPVSQWGLRTVGQVGGYDENEKRYTSLLGVETAEEYRFGYYPGDANIPGPTWGYSGQVTNTNLNEAYNGKKATKARYDAYRAGGVHPIRGTGGYDPVYNTNAADYCMRKNRDENGDSIISGAEVKWYLPTPAQLMQISLWRSAFNYSFNLTYSLFTSNYWTVNEVDGTNALALNFAAKEAGVFTSAVSPLLKGTQTSIRCVRDIPLPTGGSPIIYEHEGHLYGDLTGHLPGSILADKTNWQDKSIISFAGNEKMQPTLIISKRYVQSGNGILTSGAGTDYCAGYSEVGDTYLGKWRLPTQREMSFIYAYTGMIDDLLITKFGVNGYDSFKQEFHWAATDDGNGGHFWGVHFGTGQSQMFQKNQFKGYFRCVKYISSAPIP